MTRIFAIILALDILGLIVSLGNEDLVHTLTVGTPINAPFTFVAVQAVIVLAATRHRVAAAVLAVLCGLSLLSGALDGAYGADLAAAERAIQVGIVVATVALGAAAVRAAVRPAVS